MSGHLTLFFIDLVVAAVYAGLAASSERESFGRFGWTFGAVMFFGLALLNLAMAVTRSS